MIARLCLQLVPPQATRDVWRWAEGALPAVHALLRCVAAEVGADTRGAWVSASVRFGRALAAFAASLHEMVATCGGAGHVCAEAVRGAESLLAASTQAKPLDCLITCACLLA
jgi:hypothetical protein